MAVKLTHIALRVNNIECSAAFYKKYADLDLVAQRQENHTRVAWLGNARVKDHFVIVLLEMPYQNGDQPSYDHLGLEVASLVEIDRRADLARQEGVLAFGPQHMGPVAGYLCLIRDPDGNRVEFSYNQKIEAALENAELMEPETP